MEGLVVRLNTTIAVMFSVCIFGCGFLSDTSYEDDVANDRSILAEIIKANPVLDSALKAGHYFLPYSSESGQITGELDLHKLNLYDSNFYFPKSIRNFRRVKTVLLSSNNFTELPRGTLDANWSAVLVLGNKICHPSSETVAYLDKLMAGAPGGYWRDSQHCGDSIPAASP